MTDRAFALLFAVGFCAVAMGAVYLVIDDKNEWEAFAAAHNCKKVAHMKGDVFTTTGIGTNGQMVVSSGATPDKTGYACDDGITYWR